MLGSSNLKFTARYRMIDIPNYDTFIKIEPILKGWSSDKKYYVETKDEQRLLLRRSGVVDPYYDLMGVMVTAEVSTQFSIGQLHSYFGGSVPDDFWELNAYYMVAESINAFAVAVTLGQEEIDYSNKMSKATLEWFDNFNNLVPSWYEMP